MNLFRPEEHIARWLGAREPGATIPVVKLSELARAKSDDRLSRSDVCTRASGTRRILDGLGLIGEFWRLP